MCRKELDYAIGHFSVFPGGLVHSRNPEWPKDEPYLHIDEECPQEIKERLLKDWPRILKETKERHSKFIFSSLDYF